MCAWAPLYLTWSSTQFIIKNKYSNLLFRARSRVVFFLSSNSSSLLLLSSPVTFSALVYRSCHDKVEFMSRLQSYVYVSSSTSSSFFSASEPFRSFFFWCVLIPNISVEKREQYLKNFRCACHCRGYIRTCVAESTCLHSLALARILYLFFSLFFLLFLFLISYSWTIIFPICTMAILLLSKLLARQDTRVWYGIT